MSRPLFRPRWNESDNCPGPTPWAHRVWFVVAWPYGVARFHWGRGFDWSTAALIWWTWYWHDYTEPGP